MAHHTLRSAFDRLTDRLNRFPQGAPPSHLLHSILRLLFSEEEAGLVALLPIRPFTAATAAHIWKVPEARARRILETMAGKNLLLDIDLHGEMQYVLPPPMAGFFEFSLMRVREDIDQKLLSELFYQYLNVEEEFIRALFVNGETQLGRVFVHEPALSEEQALYVLDHERASRVIESASAIGIGLCYCRHKMQHLGKACPAPLDNCMTFNTTAASLIRHGAARPVEAGAALEVLAQARGCGLVQFGENVQRRVNFICNCCGCCCEALIAARRFGHLHPVHTTNFLAVVDIRRCSGCGRCIQACPVAAISLVGANSPLPGNTTRAVVNASICLGCGACVSACPQDSLSLEFRGERVITPVDSLHKTVLMAIERGKLQNLVFDNQALASHRAMAAILGVILKLPPVKQLLANRQIQSRYLAALIDRFRR